MSIPRLSSCALVMSLLLMLAAQAAQNAADLYRRAFELMPNDVSGLVEDPTNLPLDEQTQELVKRCDESLALLRQAADVPKCDWGIDYSAGPFTLLPQLQQGRLLAGVAMLRARLAFQDGQPADGVAYLLASMRLARHIGAEPVIISRLVQCNIEDMTITALAEQLPNLPKDVLASLAKGMKSLPAAAPASQTVRAELDMLSEWITQTDQPPIELLENTSNADAVRMIWLDAPSREAAVQSLRELAQDAAALLDVPEDKWAAAYAKWEDTVRNLDPLAKSFPPNMTYLREGMSRAAARSAMLEAAITIVRDGPDAAKQTRDPFGDGPFAFQQHDGGFTLSSAAVVRGEPVTLTVGK